MSHLLASGRLAGGVAATVLAATAAVALPSAAHAATPVVPDLQWNVSQQFVDHLSSRTLTGGVTFDETAGSFTFEGEGATSDATGVRTFHYDGTVRGAFGFGGNEFYSVTIADPAVSVEPDGDGRISATVSAANAAAQGNPAASTQPTLVTVAEFSGATPGSALTVTPAWDGVLPADSPEAAGLGIGAGKPVAGRSFHPEFLGALTPGVRAHFYASGAASDAKKAPGAFTASGPVVTAAVTASSHADGVTVQVQGTGFNPATRPGDNGVYVGLAPTDAVIDYDNRGSMSVFATVDWVDAGRFTEDAFSTVLVAPTDKLDPAKTYAVYTWQAHTHSNPTQDTKTPVAIDFSTLTPPAPNPDPTPDTKVKAKVQTKLAKRPTRARKGRLVVTVRGSEGRATGRVVVKVKRGKKTVKTLRVRLKKAGKASVRLPKGKRGAWRAVVQYRGDDTYKKARKVVKYRIR
jgi:hypothetical protein